MATSSDTPETRDDGVVHALVTALGDKVLTAAKDLERVAHDRSHHDWELPEAAVVATSTEDVVTAMRICHEHQSPVVPRGSGTGLEGGANTTAESICIDISGMKQVVDIAADDMYATAEAGVLKSELNAALEPHGLQFAAGPAIDPSIGGMAATSASGTTAVRYGTLKENVLALTIVLADGSVIRTGSTTKKTSAGYDLTHLFVGSEGTLGIITEVTVNLHPLPACTAVGVWSLPDLDTAAQLVVAALRASLPLTRVELLDAPTIRALKQYNGYTAKPADTIIVEFTGNEAETPVHYAQFAQLARSFNAEEFSSTTEPEEVRATWQARADVLPASQHLVPHAKVMPTDVCVPISRLPECILETKKDLETTDLIAPIAGHVGDGNFHLAILLPPGDKQAYAQAKQINQRLVDRALTMGGTCTGEHGIGIGKVTSMAKEHRSAIPAMLAIKHALDPLGILNPGKVLG